MNNSGINKYTEIERKFFMECKTSDEACVRKILKEYKGRNALIHCITHAINLNDMANTVISLNQSPIMADHPEEAGHITKGADALLINLGNLQPGRVLAMEESLKSAYKHNVPTVLDVVGIGVSNLRHTLSNKFLEKYNISVVKGNYSEITALADGMTKTRGVDNEEDDFKKATEAAEKISRKFKCTVVCTGKIDIIIHMENKMAVFNGTPRLSSLTGTGCLAGVIIASLLPHDESSGFYSSLCAMTILGISGELAGKESRGTGSFHMNLLDRISMTNENEIMELKKWKRIN